MIDYIYHTEQDAQMRTKELWSKQRPSEDKEDKEEEEEEEPMDKNKFGRILFARLACTSNLCPDAGYSNKGSKSEMQVDIELERSDCYGDQRMIQPIITKVSAF